MGANVRAKLGPSFMLDEERLRRLHQKISERSAALKDVFDFEYRVLRADTYSYTTQKIDDILAEANAGHERIVEINIQSTKDSQIDHHLSFSDDGIAFRIDGDDRDAVFLLFSDVKEYIVSSIVRRRLLNMFSGRWIPRISSLLFGVVSLIVIIGIYRDSVPAADDADAKLDFLVQQQIMINDFLPYMFGLMALVLILLFLVDMLPSIASKIWPPHLFLIGGEIGRYEKRKRIQERVVWGVVVAFIVSALAGLISGMFIA